MPVNKINKILSTVSKPVWNVSGSIFALIGIIGIFIPLLPTTPFLLIAAWCFNRGSEKMRLWFEKNKLINSYIQNYRDKKGMPLHAKIYTLLILWFTIGVSIYFLSNIYLRLVLVVVLLGISLHIITIRKYQE